MRDERKPEMKTGGKTLGIPLSQKHPALREATKGESGDSRGEGSQDPQRWLINTQYNPLLCVRGAVLVWLGNLKAASFIPGE